jgi:SAM-dependent methyltransferase
MKAWIRKHFPDSAQSLLRRLYYRRPFLRRIYYFPQDCLERITRRAGSLRPPRSLTLVGDGDFGKVGREFLGHFIRIGRLEPSDRVLEIGCGIGRMAIPLTQYLSDRGSYEGMDIVPAGIAWCKKNITPRFASFHFQLADIFNGQTNPAGRFKARDYRFPFPDESFDFVILTSVFTHMLVEDIENYLKEIARLLKSGGRCLASYFLLNPEAVVLLETGENRFKHQFGASRIVDPKMPEASIAHPEDTIRSLYRKFALRISEPIQYGYWCQRDRYLSFQDIVVAEKQACAEK